MKFCIFWIFFFGFVIAFFLYVTILCAIIRSDWPKVFTGITWVLLQWRPSQKMIQPNLAVWLLSWDTKLEWPILWEMLKNQDQVSFPIILQLWFSILWRKIVWREMLEYDANIFHHLMSEKCIVNGCLIGTRSVYLENGIDIHMPLGK